jgi:LysR family transcriptional activator of nhaA
VAELDDIALAQELALRAVGVFVAPDVIEEEVGSRYQLRVVGRAPDLRQRFYVISLERKIRHPAIVAVCDLARTTIFGNLNAD